MIWEVLDKQGRLIGLGQDLVPAQLMEHGNVVSLDIDEPEPVSMSPTRTITRVLFTVWEVKIRHPRWGNQATRWYLIAPDDMPEKAWKAPMLTDLRSAFRELRT